MYIFKHNTNEKQNSRIFWSFRYKPPEPYPQGISTEKDMRAPFLKKNLRLGWCQVSFRSQQNINQLKGKELYIRT